MKLFARFMKDESGATAIEYALLAGLIGVGIVAGTTTLGTSLDGFMNDIGTKVGGFNP